MKIRNHFFVLAAIFLLFIPLNLSASSFFSANAGGRLNYSSDSKSTEYDPNLKLEAFIESQFNFSETVWSHFNFSIKTGDFLGQELFSATDAKFKIDEISVTKKAKIEGSNNYLSLYMGTYDPVGSDIFFQRYFGQLPIASKITESWLGKASSILYPHFGIGVSDVITFNKQPMAAGLYFYVNNEDEKYFVFNADLRFACVYRFLSFDIAGGIGTPLSDKYNGGDAIVVIDTVYWHAGTTILIGNNFTQSLFIQAGIFNASFTKSDSNLITAPDDIYLLIEPRLRFKNTHLNFSVYSVPKNTAEQMLFITDTLGCNINIYNDTLSWGSNKFSVGTNFALSFPDKYFIDILGLKDDFLSMNFNVDITPYIYTNLLSGELHLQTSIKLMEFLRDNWKNGFSIDLGYRTSF